MRRGSIVLFVAFVASLFAIVHGQAQEIVGLDQIMKAIEAQRRVDAELEAGAARVEEEAREEADRLRHDEAMLDSTKPTVADLRQLRAEIDGRKIRLEAVDDRIGYMKAQMLRVEGNIKALSQTIPAEPKTLEELVQVVKLRRLRDLREQMTNSIGLLSQGRSAVRGRLAILEERLALAQAHSQIASFDEAKELAQDPRAIALRQIVTRLVEDSVRLGNQAASLTSSELQARRNLLQMHADRTFLRSNLRAGDIELLGLHKEVESLQTLLVEPAIPLRLFEDAGNALTGLSERARHRRSVITELRRQLADQDALFPVSSSDIAAQIDDLNSIGDQLRTLASDQEAEIGGLEALIARLRQEFRDRVRTVQARALFLRHSLPASTEAWEHTRDGLARLPARVGESFSRAGKQIIEAVRNSTPLRSTSANLVVVVVGLAAFWARRALRGFLIRAEPAGALVLVAAAMRDNLFTLVPAIAWYLAGKILRVPDVPLLLVFGVLAVWPTLAFVLDLTGRSLLDPASPGSAVYRRFYDQLRWTIILGGIIAGLVAIAFTLPLAPAVADLIGRAGMLCLLLIAAPAVLLPRLILTMWAETRGPPPLRIRLAAGLSALVPVALISAAILGLVGYLNLAWSMIGLLVWLLAVGAIWTVLLGVLRDGAARLREHVTQQQTDLGDFWTVDFFDPAYRLMQLALTFAAGWALFRIYGWTGETPGVRHLLAFGRAPVITLGQSTLRVQDIVIAVILGAIAFWLGGWSRQVSYNLALARIHDLSIRHSLSVFVQYVVTILGLVVVLKLIGFDLTALTFFAASLGIGIGFGLQNVVNNFISGILLLAERPLRVGDTVTIGSATGDVTRIGIRSLTVLTSEQKEVIIPNSAVVSESFTNWTKTNDTMRDVLMFRVSLFDNAEHAAQLIAEAARSTDGVLAEPPSKATIWELTELGVSIRLQYFIHATGPFFDIRDSVLRGALEALATEGFTIPTVRIDEKPLQPLERLQTAAEAYRSAARSTS
jgi:potassium-dependent mechanosensitive channel